MIIIIIVLKKKKMTHGYLPAEATLSLITLKFEEFLNKWVAYT